MNMDTVGSVDIYDLCDTDDSSEASCCVGAVDVGPEVFCAGASLVADGVDAVCTSENVIQRDTHARKDVINVCGSDNSSESVCCEPTGANSEVSDPCVDKFSDALIQRGSLKTIQTNSQRQRDRTGCNPACDPLERISRKSHKRKIKIADYYDVEAGCNDETSEESFVVSESENLSGFIVETEVISERQYYNYLDNNDLRKRKRRRRE